MLKELHSSDRDSLLAEIQQLRALVESMRNEQRQQVDIVMEYILTLSMYLSFQLHNLFEQVKKLQQVAESEKNALRLEST